MKLFEPHGWFIPLWNIVFLLFSVISLFIDPLFFFIPVVDGIQKCVEVDQNLKMVVCVLRSFTDVLYLLHIFIQLTTEHTQADRYIRGWRFIDPHYRRRGYLKSYHFFIDVLVSLPLPQLAVLIVIPNLDGRSSFLMTNLLKIVVFSQFLPRVIRLSSFYQKVMIRNSGFLTEKAWAGVAFNIFIYVLASHVVGALWYLLAIDSQLRCWNIAFEWHNNNSRYLRCGEGRVGDFSFLNTSCPLLESNEIKDSENFDFSLFLDGLRKHILETRDLTQKLLHCSLWGLRSLSSLGQGLKVSTYYGDVLFAYSITAIRLLLFGLLMGNMGLLMGNMQKYLLSFSNLTPRVEKMKERRREAEEFMSIVSLPQQLRERVRRHNDSRWKITGGIELDTFIRDLPGDLRRDIKRHLCFPLLKSELYFFSKMEEHLYDVMCELMKPVFYAKDSTIMQEGYVVAEMVFIRSGRLFMTGYGRKNNLYYGCTFGEELLRWALHPFGVPPITNRKVKTITDVQGFALGADELKFLASRFSQDFKTRLEHIFRCISIESQIWAANRIQAAWRSHCQKKREKAVKEQWAAEQGAAEIIQAAEQWAAEYIQATWRRRKQKKDLGGAE